MKGEEEEEEEKRKKRISTVHYTTLMYACREEEEWIGVIGMKRRKCWGKDMGSTPVLQSWSSNGMNSSEQLVG